MPMKTYKTEDIISKLREAGVRLIQDASVPEVIKKGTPNRPAR